MTQWQCGSGNTNQEFTLVLELAENDHRDWTLPPVSSLIVIVFSFFWQAGPGQLQEYWVQLKN
jgi:hypothetical protein